MGMGASVLPLLMKLKRQGHIANGSAVIEIGAQQLDESSSLRLRTLRRRAASSALPALRRRLPGPEHVARRTCWPERRCRASSGPGSGSTTPRSISTARPAAFRSI